MVSSERFLRSSIVGPTFLDVDGLGVVVPVHTTDDSQGVPDEAVVSGANNGINTLEERYVGPSEERE